MGFASTTGSRAAQIVSLLFGALSTAHGCFSTPILNWNQPSLGGRRTWVGASACGHWKLTADDPAPLGGGTVKTGSVEKWVDRHAQWQGHADGHVQHTETMF